MARTCGRYAQAFDYLEKALALRRSPGDRHGEAIALNNLVVSARDQADYSGVEHYCRQSLTVAHEIGGQKPPSLWFLGRVSLIMA